MIRLAQCVTYGHIGGAENYWHCKWLDFVRAISYGAGFRKCVYGCIAAVWYVCPKRLENGDIVDYFHTGEMGTLYKTIVWLGFALLTIGLGCLLVENIFRAKTKLHDVITNLVVVIAVLVMLPFGTNLFSQFVMAGAQEIVGSNGSNVTSIAVQPVQNNIVDTVALAQKGFKVDPSKLDGQMTKYNGIDQNTIGYLDLSEVVASDNLKTNAIPKGGG